jgi:PIN domain nuclease of toxin-antitoxin system
VKLLLDTHLLLWAAARPDRLSHEALRLIEDPDNEPVFSAASLWEIVIKYGLVEPDFDVDPRLLRRELLDNGYSEMAVTPAHVLAVLTLPSLHKDPFDRILIAQSIAEGVTLLTSDPVVAQYQGLVRQV